MAIEKRHKDGVTIIDVKRKINRLNLGLSIKEEIDAGRLKIILNLGNCDSVDSADLGMIVARYADVVKKGGEAGFIKY